MNDTPTLPVASIESTKPEVFSPTPHMIVWLDTAMQLETDSPTDISDKSGIDRTNWYKWLDLVGFIQWFNAEWDRRLKGHAWRLDVIGMKNGKRDFNYWKSMQQRVGNLQDKPSSLQQFNVNGEMSLEFVGGDEK